MIKGILIGMMIGAAVGLFIGIAIAVSRLMEVYEELEKEKRNNELLGEVIQQLWDEQIINTEPVKAEKKRVGRPRKEEE